MIDQEGDSIFDMFISLLHNQKLLELLLSESTRIRLLGFEASITKVYYNFTFDCVGSSSNEDHQ